MKYLCLGYLDPRPWDAMCEADREALVAESAAYGQALRRAGHAIDGQFLHRGPTTATLRFDNGTVAVTEDAADATDVRLGGILFLEARDLNHAIQLVSRLPFMRPGGSMEIRPIHEPQPSR